VLHTGRVPGERRPHPLPPVQYPPPPGHPPPCLWRGSKNDPKRLPREAGYEVRRPAGVEAIPGYSVGQGAGRSHEPNARHVILEVAVENSWPRMTGGPSGRDDLSKSRRDLLRGPAEHAVTYRTSGSPPRDEEIRAVDQDGAALISGSDREGSGPAHRASWIKEQLRFGLPFTTSASAGRSAFVIFRERRNLWRDRAKTK
jgi:hypothetical protein